VLMPKRVKYRKQQRGRMKGVACKGTNLAFGEFGLKALESAWINARHIEAARLALSRFLKQTGKIWFRIFPDKPVTKKPAETRMGKGKGDLSHWVAPVRAGRIILELGGIGPKEARRAMQLASHKFPVKTRFIEREAF
jgi:large subunit ribosomal protein L16